MRRRLFATLLAAALGVLIVGAIPGAGAAGVTPELVAVTYTPGFILCGEGETLRIGQQGSASLALREGCGPTPRCSSTRLTASDLSRLEGELRALDFSHPSPARPPIADAGSAVVSYAGHTIERGGAEPAGFDAVDNDLMALTNRYGRCRGHRVIRAGQALATPVLPFSLQAALGLTRQHRLAPGRVIVLSVDRLPAPSRPTSERVRIACPSGLRAARVAPRGGTRGDGVLYQGAGNVRAQHALVYRYRLARAAFARTVSLALLCRR